MVIDSDRWSDASQLFCDITFWNPYLTCITCFQILNSRSMPTM